MRYLTLHDLGCADASSFTAGQPATIPAGGRTTVSIPGSVSRTQVYLINALLNR